MHVCRVINFEQFFLGLQRVFASIKIHVYLITILC